ncbi:tetratricopeptide repeat protein [Streptomyces sp. NPDC090088]|uniref:tetratricopeptide repeat protein n=1 Tax=Streptomyces sp. NPDC090088 TaxID=3365944 RepID=UPI00382C586F
MTYQIPPEAACFVDREPEQARAFGAFAEGNDRSRPLCLVLKGLAGVGKTELAFRIARHVRDRYPDGVLYVDLDEWRRDGAVEVDDVLRELLRSLGVGAEWLERSFQARRKQYWTRTDGKRLLVVIDNARYGAEVVPLLPASGRSLVIITSQGPLYDLEDGAVLELPLGPLDDGYALDLLRQVVDDPRLAAEPEAAAGLVRLCSGLPAALHVAGRWMRRHRRRPLERLLAELTTELHDKGVAVVERVWDAAYTTLSPHTQTLYRLLAAAPSTSFTTDSATALLGMGREKAEEALEELESAGLLDLHSERIRLPELLRAHAARCAERDGADDLECAEGQRRIVHWYLRQAQRADTAAAGTRLTLAAAVPPIENSPDVSLAPSAPNETAASRALGWLQTERLALYGCVRIAYTLRLDEEAWALCEPLWTHYLDHPYSSDLVETFRTAVLAAQRAGQVPALIRMRCQLARPLWERGDVPGAQEQLEKALAAAETLSDTDTDRKLAASVTEFHGMFRQAQGDWAGAATDFQTALETHRTLNNTYGVMLQTYRWGQALAGAEQWEPAAPLLEQAHTMARDLGRERMTARTAFALGQVLHRLGRTDQARALYDEALTGAVKRSAQQDQAAIHDCLATLAQDTADETQAAQHRETAAIIRRRNGALA